MNKNIKWLFVMIAILVLPSCASNSRTEILNNSSDQKNQDEKIVEIFESIEKEDVDSLKALFCNRALDESENFDEDAEGLFEFVEGSMTSWEASSGPTVFESVEDGNIVKEVDSYFYVETEFGKYFVMINDYPLDDINTDNQGINMLLVVSANHRLDLYKPENEILYKDSQKLRPSGIFIPIQ